MATRERKPGKKSTAAKKQRRARPKKKGPTKSQIQELVGKALTDTDFRTRLSADPVTAAGELGIRFSTKQVTALKAMAPELEKYAEGLRRRDQVACGPGVLIPIADVGIVAAFA